MPSPFTAFRHRNFRLFFTGQFISLTGTWMQVVAQSWLVLQLSNSAFLVGLVSALGSLPILLLTLYGGVLADRVNKRRAILLLQAGMLCEALTLGTLTVLGHVSVGWLMALAVVQGTLAAFEVPMRQSFMIEMVGRDDLVNAIALNSSIFNLTRILGPVVAGALVGSIGAAACFFVNSASFLAVIIGLLLMRPPFVGQGGSPRTGEATFNDGVRYALGTPGPRALLTLAAILSIFGLAAALTMLPVYARNVLGQGAAGYGGLMAAVGVGAGSGAIAMAAVGRRMDPLRVIRGGSLLFAASLAITMLHVSYLLAVIGLALAGLGSVLAAISTNSLLQTESPDQLRGRVMGFYSFVVLGLAPFGSLQAGFISEQFGVRVCLVIGALICGLAVLVLLPREVTVPVRDET